MKNTHYLRNALLLFWFAWFALGGIAVTGIVVWVSPITMTVNEILVAGSTIGIITGGIAAFMLFVFACLKHGASFMKELDFTNFFDTRQLKTGSTKTCA